MKHTIERMYLEYVNDFLSVSGFADHYDITIEKATRIINIGRKLNQRRAVS
jgi:hypothetical protein